MIREHQRRRVPACVSLLLCFSPAVLIADDSAPLVFRDAHIFDGIRVIGRGTVVVQTGTIQSVSNRAKLPERARIIDCAGKTLLPGFIDAHTHVRRAAGLELAVVLGVTTELDMFTTPRQLAEIRGARPDGAPARADLFSAGILATVPGGHGTEYGFAIPTISDPSEAVSFVDARLAEGSDYIKIVYDSGASTFSKMSKEVMRALVSAARLRGKMTIVHIHTLEDGRDAIEAGANGLAHMFSDRLPDTAWIRLARKQNAFVIPTFTVLASIYGIPGGASLAKHASIAPYLNSGQSQNLMAMFSRDRHRSGRYEIAQQAVAMLRQGGVRLLAGTDAPNPGTAHGASIHQELELLVQAGLTPVEALAAATSTPAECFALADRGMIAAGRKADLVLVEGDPTTAITRTRNIVGVWKAGRAIDRESYRRHVQ